MLSVTNKSIVLIAECHYAECHYAECHYAECHYAESRYAECRGTKHLIKGNCFNILLIQ
jgi:hypothetical protein